MALRQTVRVLVLGTSAALLLASPAAGGEESGWRQALERFAQEKTLAEGCVSLLSAFAERDPMARVQGQRLYGRAKADVDGLIALLAVDLAGDRSPAAIPELRYRLQAVPRQRQALCRYVDSAVATAVRERSQDPGADKLLGEGTADAASSLLDAAVLTWQEYRRAGEGERASIIAAVEAARWRDYGEVPPGVSR
jgi:hypothetical protein